MLVPFHASVLSHIVLLTELFHALAVGGYAQSQTDKIYFDELGATAAEASKMTPAEIAERYAEYKIHMWSVLGQCRTSVMTQKQLSEAV